MADLEIQAIDWGTLPALTTFRQAIIYSDRAPPRLDRRTMSKRRFRRERAKLRGWSPIIAVVDLDRPAAGATTLRLEMAT